MPTCDQAAHSASRLSLSPPGEDLHKVLWLKSRNSEVWLERRTNYTRSTAVMSMVGGRAALGGCWWVQLLL